MGQGPGLPIIVAGIDGSDPFTVNHLPYISDDTPKTITPATKALIVNPGLVTEAFVFGTADPAPAAVEVLRVFGGIISKGASDDSMVIGRGAVATVLEGVAIGLQASASGTGRALAIGPRAQASQNTVNGDALAIGDGANATPSAGGSQQSLLAIGSGARAGWGSSLAIGFNASAGANTRTPCLAIGVTALASFDDTLAIGHGALAKQARTLVIGNTIEGPGGGGDDIIGFGSNTHIGNSASTMTDCIVIGNSISFSVDQSNFLILGHGLTDAPASNTGYIGAQQTILSTIYIGRGATHTAAHDVVLRDTAVTGGNVNGGAIILHTGDGSGTGRPGLFRVRMRNAAGSTAIYLQFGQPTATGTRLDLVAITSGDFVVQRFQDNGGAQKADVGIAGAAGDLIDDSGAGDLCLVGYSNDHVRIGVSAGTGDATVSAIDVTASDIILDARAGNLRFNNFTNGAAANVGTLNNAPSVGNPAFWLRVNIAGNVRYIPCWA